jgi:hypothetical protein
VMDLSSPVIDFNSPTIDLNLPVFDLQSPVIDLKHGQELPTNSKVKPVNVVGDLLSYSILPLRATNGRPATENIPCVRPIGGQPLRNYPVCDQ